MGDQENMAWALQLFGVAVADSQCDVAARILGATEALRETLGSKLEGIELTLHERALAALASHLRPAALAEAWAAGRALQPDEAAALALAG
jgi:hypothetical protein